MSPAAALRILGVVLATLFALPPSPGTASDAAAARGPETNLPLPRFVSIRAETANARRGPGLEHRVDWAFVQRGLPVEVTAEYGHWRRIRDADGLGGWVHYSLLSGSRTVLVLGSAPVPLRAKPDEQAVVRALAEPGAVARLEACAEVWCEIGADGLSGWLPRAVLWGVGPDESVE